MAGATGFEPAASGVTGRRSNQLNYAPVTGKHSEKQIPDMQDPMGFQPSLTCIPHHAAGSREARLKSDASTGTRGAQCKGRAPQGWGHYEGRSISQG